MRRLLVLAAACATLAPAGCANLNSISRTRFTSGEAAVHYADAQQWGVLSQRWAEYPHEGGAGYWVYRSCAQPSPDVFSVLGFSLAGAISRDKQDDGKSLNAEVATALSQSGATISRTQTVNLLRESMYRTCERFMNGAMSEEQFLVQAARDQRAMIAILAIEQLTGVVLPSSTVIVANGTAIQTDRPLEVLEKLEEAEADEAEKAAALTGAKTKAAAAETKYKTLNKDDACKKLLEAKAETPSAMTRVNTSRRPVELFGLVAAHKSSGSARLSSSGATYTQPVSSTAPSASGIRCSASSFTRASTVARGPGRNEARTR